MKVNLYLAPTPYKGEAIQAKPASAGYKPYFSIIHAGGSCYFKDTIRECYYCVRRYELIASGDIDFYEFNHISSCLSRYQY
jgi:hypothetical protein